MSRCFPYPPPGYTLSRASNEALIESIKDVKSERKIAKELNKEKKREKKERKKEKKEKRKQINAELDQKLQKLGKTELLLKEKESQACELLERSSLTEEHGQSVCLNAPSTSSESTDTSNKRKRDSSSIDNRGPGKIIRIKLAPKKQSDSQAPASNELRVVAPAQQKDSNILPVVTPAQQKDSNILRVGTGNSQSLSKPEGLMCSTLRPVGAPMPRTESTARPHVKAGNCSWPVTAQQFKTGSPHRSVDTTNHVKTANPLRPTEVFKQVKTGIPSRPAEAKQLKTGIPPRSTAALKQVKNGVSPPPPVEAVKQVKTRVPQPPVEAVKQVKTGVPPRPVEAVKLLKTGLSPRPVETAKQVNPIISSWPVDPTKLVAASPVEPLTRVGTCPPPVPSAPLTPMEIDSTNYNKLFGNFSLPQLEVPCADEDLSWLFPQKRSDAVAEKQQKIQYDVISCANSSALQPRAQWLKEGDIYVLPYTVPF